MMAKPKLKLLKFKSHRDRARLSSIETLQEALRQAKQGDVVAVGIAVVRPTGAVNCSRSETDDVARLLGAVALLNHRTLVATENEE
jgi:translation elongation factor EF-1alpha